MNRISALLVFLFIPMSIEAQKTHTNTITDKNLSLAIHKLQVDQQSTSGSQFWLNIGPGIGSSGSISGIASASYQFGGNLLSLRVSTTGELFGDHFSDIGLLYGRATTNESYHISFAAGLARVTGRRSEGLFGSTEDVSPSFGLPLELQFFWKPASFFGLGVTGFANINPEQSFAGIALSLQLGKLR